MTTSTPSRITIARIPRIADDPYSMQQLRDGLANASAFMPDELAALDDQDPALFEWDRVTEAAVTEIAPAVAAMLQAAIERRLPWSSGDR